MNITLNPFDVKSIDNAIAMVEKFSKDTLDKMGELIAAMVEEGEQVALTLCLPSETGDTGMSILDESKVEGARNEAVGYIIAGGAAIWLEFGTGVAKNEMAGVEYPGVKPPNIVEHGSYEKGKGASGELWAYYDDKQGKVRVTRGIAARAFMWQSATYLRNHFPEIARKVWKG